MSNRYTVIFDGGHDRNGGYGSYIIFKGHKPVCINLRTRFDETQANTGNQAEYYTLVTALDALSNVAEAGSKVQIFGDSKLVLCQIKGEWKARNTVMRRYRDECQAYLNHYEWQATWWPREQSLQFFQH